MNSRNQNNNVAVHQDIKAKQKRYEALVREMHSDVYRYAYWLVKDKAVAEDIVQETFLRAWKSLDSLKDQKAAKAWLITILRRENARRFERKQFDLVDMDDVSLADTGLGEDTKAEHRELRKLMGNLRNSLCSALVSSPRPVSAKETSSISTKSNCLRSNRRAFSLRKIVISHAFAAF